MNSVDNLCQTGWLICLFFVQPQSTNLPIHQLCRCPRHGKQTNKQTTGYWLSRAIWTLSSTFFRMFCHRSKRYRSTFRFAFTLAPLWNAIDFDNLRFPRFEENGPVVLAIRMPVFWSIRAKLVALSDAAVPKWKNSVRYLNEYLFMFLFSFFFLMKPSINVSLRAGSSSRRLADLTCQTRITER